jgi:hypothetical protein
MFAKSRPDKRLAGAFLAALAASQLVGLVLFGAKALRRWIAKREDVDAAGLSAKDRFDLYADLEYAREQERAKRRLRFDTRTEAS